MYKITILIITLVIAGTANAFAQQALISGGGIFITNTVSLSWSLGEIATETFVANNLVLTQGMQQPTKKVTGIYQNKAELTELSIYPNPVKEVLFIDLGDQISDDFEIRITDAQGKLVGTKSTNIVPAHFETGQIEPGLYLFNLIKNNQIIYSSYIVKN